MMTDTLATLREPGETVSETWPLSGATGRRPKSKCSQGGYEHSCCVSASKNGS